MAMKFIFFVAVALAAPLASAISHQDLWDEADILKDTINNTAMIMLMGRYNQTHVLECFEMQAKNFELFGKTIKDELVMVAEELRGEIGDPAARQLRKIGKDIKNLTRVFWPTMKSGNHEKAFEERDEAGERVRRRAETFADQVKCRQLTNPKVVVEAYKKVRNVHDEARARSREMSTAIGKCAKEGPKPTSEEEELFPEIFAEK